MPATPHPLGPSRHGTHTLGRHRRQQSPLRLARRRPGHPDPAWLGRGSPADVRPARRTVRRHVAAVPAHLPRPARHGRVARGRLGAQLGPHAGHPAAVHRARDSRRGFPARRRVLRWPPRARTPASCRRAGPWPAPAVSADRARLPQGNRADAERTRTRRGAAGLADCRRARSLHLHHRAADGAGVAGLRARHSSGTDGARSQVPRNAARRRVLAGARWRAAAFRPTRAGPARASGCRSRLRGPDAAVPRYAAREHRDSRQGRPQPADRTEGPVPRARARLADARRGEPNRQDRKRDQGTGILREDTEPVFLPRRAS